MNIDTRTLRQAYGVDLVSRSRPHPHAGAVWLRETSVDQGAGPGPARPGYRVRQGTEVEKINVAFR